MHLNVKILWIISSDQYHINNDELIQLFCISKDRVLFMIVCLISYCRIIETMLQKNLFINIWWWNSTFWSLIKESYYSGIVTPSTYSLLFAFLFAFITLLSLFCHNPVFSLAIPEREREREREAKSFGANWTMDDDGRRWTTMDDIFIISSNNSMELYYYNQ
jgi:hypothetical protein